jgi:methionyl-tRNA formyltransferase
VSIVLFTSNLTGELLLHKLDSLKVYPDVVTYNTGVQKTALSRDFSKFRGMFPMHFVSANKYEEAKREFALRSDDVAVCVDWTKDFFLETDIRAVFAHPSLLPLYRGYSAVTEQFMRGVAVSGASFYFSSDRVDAGDVLTRKEIRIEYEDYPEDFFDKYASACAEFIKELASGGLGSFQPEPQDDREAFYLARKRRREGVIDFNRDAHSLYNHIRAFSRPFFGAYQISGDRQITVWRAKTEKWQGIYGTPGTAVDFTPYGAEIACGSGSLIIEEAELDGRIYKRGDVHQLYRDAFSGGS